MIPVSGVFDLWTLLVIYVFGSFWIAILALALLMFIIMGILGRISIWTVTWYLLMFVSVMCLGYAVAIVSLLISLALLVAFYFSVTSYFNRGQQ